MNRTNADTVFGLIIIALAAFLYYQTFTFSLSLIPAPIETTFMPRLLLGIIALLGVMLLIRSFRMEVKTSKGVGNFWVKPILMGIVLLIFIMIVPYFGYYISIALVLFCSLLIFGEFNLKRNILFILAMLIATYLIFDKALNVLLPVGLLFDKL